MDRATVEPYKGDVAGRAFLRLLSLTALAPASQVAVVLLGLVPAALWVLAPLPIDQSPQALAQAARELAGLDALVTAACALAAVSRLEWALGRLSRATTLAAQLAIIILATVGLTAAAQALQHLLPPFPAWHWGPAMWAWIALLGSISLALLQVPLAASARALLLASLAWIGPAWLELPGLIPSEKALGEGAAPSALALAPILGWSLLAWCLGARPGARA